MPPKCPPGGARRPQKSPGVSPVNGQMHKWSSASPSTNWNRTAYPACFVQGQRHEDDGGLLLSLVGV